MVEGPLNASIVGPEAGGEGLALGGEELTLDASLAIGDEQLLVTAAGRLDRAEVKRQLAAELAVRLDAIGARRYCEKSAVEDMRIARRGRGVPASYPHGLSAALASGTLGAMVVPAVVVLLGFAALAWLEPGTARWLAAKEGPLEQVGHAMLAVALVGWLVAAWRAEGEARRHERWGCIAFVAMCGLVLGEELDWGGVYGVGPLGDALYAATGRPNLHNAWHGASYVAFAILPLVLVGVVGWRRADDPGRLPRRSDAVGLVGLGASSLLGTLLWPAWELELDEVAETALYVGLTWISLRPVATDRRGGHRRRAPRAPAFMPYSARVPAPTDPERAARARRRASWPGLLTTHEDQADAAIVRDATPGERVAMVWQVTLDAWASSGRPLPEYTRAEIPGRVIRSRHG